MICILQKSRSFTFLQNQTNGSNTVTCNYILLLWAIPIAFQIYKCIFEINIELLQFFGNYVGEDVYKRQTQGHLKYCFQVKSTLSQSFVQRLNLESITQETRWEAPTGFNHQSTAVKNSLHLLFYRRLQKGAAQMMADRGYAIKIILNSFWATAQASGADKYRKQLTDTNRRQFGNRLA